MGMTDVQYIYTGDGELTASWCADFHNPQR